MFPLGMVIFPHQVVGLMVFEPRYQQLLSDIGDDGVFGTCLISRGSEVGGGDQRTTVGTLLALRGKQTMQTGEQLLRVEGLECFEIERWLDDAPYPRAVVSERCCDQVSVLQELVTATESAVRAVRNLQSEVMVHDGPVHPLVLSDETTERVWQLCAQTPMPTLDQFSVLSKSDPNDRLRLVLEICCERYGDFERMLNEGRTEPDDLTDLE